MNKVLDALRSQATLGLFGLVGLVGCNQAGTVPIEGVVTLGGKPLGDAVVMFAPLHGNGPGPFVGNTDSVGRFRLGPKDRPGSGVAVGDYAVHISTVRSDPSDLNPATPKREVVPNRYRNGSFHFSAPEGGDTAVTFAM